MKQLFKCNVPSDLIDLLQDVTDIDKAEIVKEYVVI